MTDFYAQFVGYQSQITDEVLEVSQDPFVIDGQSFTLSQQWSQSYIDTCVQCPEGTVQGCIYDRNGDQHWTNPDGSTSAGPGEPWIPPARAESTDVGNGNPPPPPTN